MKIKLIEPSIYLNNGSVLKAKQLFFPSLTLPLLAALAPRDIEISIINDSFEEIDFEDMVDLVGITSYTIEIMRAYDIADEFRNRDVPVVMGGIHVSMMPEEALKHADTVIIGEAEETWPEFLRDFRNGDFKKIYNADKRPGLIDLPIPLFSLLNRNRYTNYNKSGLYRYFPTPILPIQTARGCPYSCEYCSVSTFTGAKYRPRPISDVLNEIKVLNAKMYFFIDDNIFASQSRSEKFLKSLIPLKIKWIGQATIDAAKDDKLIQLAKESGCIALGVGIESISQPNLESIGKSINKVNDYEKNLKKYKKAGISVIANLMFGFDEDTTETFLESYNFLMKNGIPYTLWAPITPLPGTVFYERMKKNGRLKSDKWWLNRNLMKERFGLRFYGAKMEDDEFISLFLFFFKKFYSLSSIIRRILLPPQRRFILKTIANLIVRRKINREIGVLEG